MPRQSNGTRFAGAIPGCILGKQRHGITTQGCTLGTPKSPVTLRSHCQRETRDSCARQPATSACGQALLLREGYLQEQVGAVNWVAALHVLDPHIWAWEMRLGGEA